MNTPTFHLSTAAEVFVPRPDPAVSEAVPALPAVVVQPSLVTSDPPDPPAGPEPAAELDCDDLGDLLLQQFLALDNAAPTPPPCQCQSLPVGSCPETIKNYIGMVSQLRNVPGCPAKPGSCATRLRTL